MLLQSGAVIQGAVIQEDILKLALADVVNAGLSRDAALQNAPRTDGASFEVQATLTEPD